MAGTTSSSRRTRACCFIMHRSAANSVRDAGWSSACSRGSRATRTKAAAERPLTSGCEAAWHAHRSASSESEGASSTMHAARIASSSASDSSSWSPSAAREHLASSESLLSRSTPRRAASIVRLSAGNRTGSGARGIGMAAAAARSDDCGCGDVAAAALLEAASAAAAAPCASLCEAPSWSNDRLRGGCCIGLRATGAGAASAAARSGVGANTSRSSSIA